MPLHRDGRVRVIERLNEGLMTVDIRMIKQQYAQHPSFTEELGQFANALPSRFLMLKHSQLRN
jgi:hypothetical protein